MAYHNEDIAACSNDNCPKRFTCLRWQLGTNKDPYQTYLDGSMCDEEFYVEMNKRTKNIVIMEIEEIIDKITLIEEEIYNYIINTEDTFRDSVKARWLEWNGKVKELQIKEKEEELDYHKKRIGEIEKAILELKNE